MLRLFLYPLDHLSHNIYIQCVPRHENSIVSYFSFPPLRQFTFFVGYLTITIIFLPWKLNRRHENPMGGSDNVTTLSPPVLNGRSVPPIGIGSHTDMVVLHETTVNQSRIFQFNNLRRPVIYILFILSNGKGECC